MGVELLIVLTNNDWGLVSSVKMQSGRDRS